MTRIRKTTKAEKNSNPIWGPFVREEGNTVVDSGTREELKERLKERRIREGYTTVFNRMKKREGNKTLNTQLTTPVLKAKLIVAHAIARVKLFDLARAEVLAIVEEVLDEQASRLSA
jgi:hypothetical protein